jgi:exonuclease-1
MPPCAQVCRSLRFSATSVPRDYEQRFQLAIWVFRHQRVFCPHSGAMVHLNPLPSGGIAAADVDVLAAVPEGEELQALSFLGPQLEADVARGIAAGASRGAPSLARHCAGCDAPGHCSELVL